MRILKQKFLRRFVCSLKQPGILKDVCQTKIQRSALTDAEEISRTAKSQIFACNKKSIVGFVEDFQPFFRLF